MIGELYDGEFENFPREDGIIKDYEYLKYGADTLIEENPEEEVNDE